MRLGRRHRLERHDRLSSAAQAAVIGGGVLITLTGIGNAVNLSQTNGNKDSVYGTKGAITLNGAQANVFGGKNNITFASGTIGNVVYLYDTQGAVGQRHRLGRLGASHQRAGQRHRRRTRSISTAARETRLSLYSTNGVWDTVYATSGQDRGHAFTGLRGRSP